MAEPTAWMSIDGKLVKYADAKIHLRSPAVRYGASVFEGLRAYWNKAKNELFLFRLDAHWTRLANSMEMVRMRQSPDIPDLTDALLELIRASHYEEDIHGIVTAYLDSDDGLPMIGRRGGDQTVATTVPVPIAMVAYPYGRSTPSEGWNVVVSSWARISDRSMPPRIKAGANYLNTRLAKLQAEIDGYDSAVMLTDAGKVCEGLSCTIFVIRNGQAVTPPPSDGILEGITRDTLSRLIPKVADLPVVERSIDRTELYVADEIFVCGTGVELVPILSVDRHPIGDGHPGPITRRIMEAYFAIVRGEEADSRGWLTPVYAAVQAGMRQ